MNTLTLTNSRSTRKIVIDKEQIIALDSITASITRIYMRGGIFRDVAESLKTIKNLVQSGQNNA